MVGVPGHQEIALGVNYVSERGFKLGVGGGMNETKQ